MVNELGMVLAWRILEDPAIPSDLLQDLSQRPNMLVEEVHSDRCCGEVLVWEEYFPDAHLFLDLFHAIQRVIREISKTKKWSSTAAKAFAMCFRGTTYHASAQDHSVTRLSVRTDVIKEAAANHWCIEDVLVVGGILFRIRMPLSTSRP